MERFLTFPDENGFSLLEGLERAAEAPGLTGRAVKALNGFHRFFREIYDQRDQLPVSRLTKEILEKSGYLREPGRRIRWRPGAAWRTSMNFSP